MGATGSIGKQEAAPVERRVNSLDTVDNRVLFVDMNKLHITINQASSGLQSMETHELPSIDLHVKIV